MKIILSTKEKYSSLLYIILYLAVCGYFFLNILKIVNTFSDPRIILLSVAIIYGLLRIYGLVFWPKMEVKNNKLFIYKLGWKLNLRKSFPLSKIKKVRIVKKSDGFGSFITNNCLTVEAGMLTSDEIDDLLRTIKNMGIEIENSAT